MKKILLILLTLAISLYGQGGMKFLTSISGEKEGDHFSRPCPVGDVNGDGFDDFIIGSSEGGYVKLYFGGNPFDTLNCLRFSIDGSGNAYIGVGDLNGDEYSDFVLGSNYGMFLSGKIYVYLGKQEITATPDFTITSIRAYDRLGPATITGDLNGDGYDDLVTSAMDGEVAKGRVNIYWGGAQMDTIPDIVLYGKDVGDVFGLSCEIVGDVNKDGYDDLLVGVPQIFSEISKKGKAFLFYGGKDMGWENSVEIVPDTNALSYGIQVAELGDVDGDGYPDFAIRSWYVDIFSGKTLSLIKKIIPSQNWGTFQTVSNGADLNGDGNNDFILGFENKVNKYTGGAAVYLGGKEIDTIPALIINGNYPDSYYANYIRIGGNINGDDKTEVFIGENGRITYDGKNEGIGKVYIYNWDSTNSIVEKDDLIPSSFQLFQNYPNPFNPETIISWQLAVSSFVTLKVFDVLGREIATLVNEYQPAGHYNYQLSSNNLQLPSGVYFYQLKTMSESGNSEQNFVQTKKMVYLK